MTQTANDLLKELENRHEHIYQHSVLSNLKLKDDSFVFKMNYLIKSMLQGILHLNSLTDLVDKQLIRLLCKAFYGEAKVEELEGTDNVHPDNPNFVTGCEKETRIFSALLIVYVSDQLIKLFNEWYELDWVETFENQKNTFDKKAEELLSTSHKGNRRKTKTLLTEGYYAIIANKNSKSTTLLEVADRANAHKFLALPCVQRFIDRVWVNGMNSVKKVEVELPLIRDETENQERTGVTAISQVAGPLTEERRMQVTVLSNTTTTSTFETVIERAPFYKRPRNIFVVHTLFYLLYMVLYGLFLQHMYSLGRSFENNEINWRLVEWAFGLIFWQITFVWETYVVEVRGSSLSYSFLYWNYHRYTLLHWIFLVLNTIPLAILFICTLLDIHLRIELTPKKEWLILLYEFFFYLNFVYTSLRSLLILTISSFFGTIIFTIENMFKTFFKFAPVIIVFWLVYSTVQLSLTDVTMDKNFVWAIFIHGAFELVQDTQDETKSGSIQSVGNVKCPDETKSVLGKQCFLRRGMAPVVLFFYIMGASVLVINILTTLINQQYDDAQAKASHHWNSRKLRRTMLYQRSHLPPPFNIFVDFVAYLSGSLCSGEGINKLRGLKKKNSDRHCYAGRDVLRDLITLLQVISEKEQPVVIPEDKRRRRTFSGRGELQTLLTLGRAWLAGISWATMSSSNVESGNQNQNDNVPFMDAEENVSGSNSTDRDSLIDGITINVKGFDSVNETEPEGN